MISPQIPCDNIFEKTPEIVNSQPEYLTFDGSKIIKMSSNISSYDKGQLFDKIIEGISEFNIYLFPEIINPVLNEEIKYMENNKYYIKTNDKWIISNKMDVIKRIHNIIYNEAKIIPWKIQ